MFKFKYLFALIICCFSFSAAAETDCYNVEQTTVAQCEALKAVWENTNGPSWNDSESNLWMQTNNPCEWDGVSCWGSKVVYLLLGSKGLNGTLPELNGLPELRIFDVGNNQLQGKVPDLAKNKKLEKIYLHNNQFMGIVPDLSDLPNLVKFVAFNNPDIDGPIVFNDNPSAQPPVVHNTNLCRSRVIDYKHWTSSVEYLAACNGLHPFYYSDLSFWEITPNDNKDDSDGFNQLLKMLYYAQGEYTTDVTLYLESGIYDFDQSLTINKLSNIRFLGTSSPYANDMSQIIYPNPSQTLFVKSDAFNLLWDMQQGAMVSIFGSSNIQFEQIVFRGKTDSLSGNNNKDHGITNVNSCGTSVLKSGFANFGAAAIADYSIDHNMTGLPCDGLSGGTLIKENAFYNVCSLTTANGREGSTHLTLENNQFENLKCGLKFHSRRHLENNWDQTLTIRENTITGPGSDYMGYANGIEVSGYSNVLIENNHISHGPNSAIALFAYQNNFTVDDFNWGSIRVENNTIENYQQAVYVYNEAKANGFQPTASQIELKFNTILSSWGSMNKAHIHFIGDGYWESSITSNEIHGGQYDIWVAPWGVNAQYNTFFPSP
ncbi:right-handed parallel beta-helix repeat-containing protein [Aliikangiella sp. IMCC44632]